MPSKNRLIREAVPIVILVAFIVIGYQSSALITCSLVGGLLAGMIRMLTRDPEWSTVSPRSHWLWTIVIPASVAGLLLGWSRNWKSFALNAVLVPLPIGFALGVFAFQFSPSVGKQHEEGREQLAALERNIDLVEADIEMFTKGFEEGTLILVNNEYLRTGEWKFFGADAWLLDLMALSFKPADWFRPDLPIRDVFMDVADAYQWDSAALFMSRETQKAYGERMAAHVLEQTGSTIDELFETEEGKQILLDVPDLEYSSISFLTCLYDSQNKELVSFTTMSPGYYLNASEIPVFDPLEDLCQKVVDGEDLSHLQGLDG